jgi:hypothetical protein
MADNPAAPTLAFIQKCKSIAVGATRARPGEFDELLLMLLTGVLAEVRVGLRRELIDRLSQLEPKDEDTAIAELFIKNDRVYAALERMATVIAERPVDAWAQIEVIAREHPKLCGPPPVS